MRRLRSDTPRARIWPPGPKSGLEWSARTPGAPAPGARAPEAARALAGAAQRLRGLEHLHVVFRLHVLVLRPVLLQLGPGRRAEPQPGEVRARRIIQLDGVRQLLAEVAVVDDAAVVVADRDLRARSVARHAGGRRADAGERASLMSSDVSVEVAAWYARTSTLSSLRS